MNSTEAETNSHMRLSDGNNLGEVEQRIIDRKAEYSVLKGIVMKELDLLYTEHQLKKEITMSSI